MGTSYNAQMIWFGIVYSIGISATFIALIFMDLIGIKHKKWSEPSSIWELALYSYVWPITVLYTICVMLFNRKEK